MEEAVAKFFERAISHEMMQAELRGELTGVRRELEGMVSEVSDLFDQDELTHEAIEKLQQDFEALDSRFQNLDIRPFINESQRSVQGQVTAMGKKYAQELKKVEDSASQMLRRVELLEEQAKVGSKAGSTLTQEQVEQMINLKLAGVMEGVSQGGSGVDGEMVQAIIDQKIGWFTAKALEELVRQKVDTAVQGGTTELMERVESLEERVSGDTDGREINERLADIETRLGAAVIRELASGDDSSPLAASLKALEELIRVQTEGVRLQIGSLKSEMGQTLEAHGHEV
ncbi:hypothetical protein H1R20_g14098, partial [Candolleomyces eurysporus]